MRRVLALVVAARADHDGATEWLRALAALAAVGARVELVETGPGIGALSSARAEPSEDGARFLAALAEDGIVPRPVADPAREIAEADALLVLADPDRPQRPALLALVRGRRPDPSALAALATAGAVTLSDA